MTLGARPRVPGIPARKTCRAADDDARTQPQIPQDGIADGARGVVEVHIDTVRTRLTELHVEIRAALIVDGRVKAKFLETLPRLLRAACDADSSTAFELCDLTRARSHRTGRGGDHHSIPRLG